MIKTSVFSMLITCAGLATCAQTSQNKYYLPDGKEVAIDKLDSVKKAWGRDFLMSHNDKKPNEIHISPITDEYLKQQEAKKSLLNEMLNHAAPDFTLNDLSGKQWKLSALKGKIVVLNFWFTTCGGCIDEMPELNELKKSYSKSDIVFLALALDNSQAITSFLKKHSFAYTQLPKAGVISKAYQVSLYPTSIVIDREGVIRLQHIGSENTAKVLRAAINEI
jgi:peroxiredoxin